MTGSLRQSGCDEIDIVLHVSKMTKTPIFADGIDAIDSFVTWTL